MAATSGVPPHKRLMVLCDGTWINSDIGYNKPTLFQQGSLQIPSNVTRMSRCLKHRCSDNTLQVINYQSGVGTGSSIVDVLAGGAFGVGIAEHIREAYAFICSNYSDGDEIILVGFSRGAFTARSVAGMIGDLGLLTQAGMEYFYPIFKDMENWETPNYKDPFPGMPFANKPRGPNAAEAYRKQLLDLGFTRVYQNNNQGPLITVKAVAVWETVGSLGIPRVPWLTKLGITGSTQEYRFFDTNLSDRIEHAFQALAMDEPRPMFSPAVWERTPKNRDSTELRQVWFPGNHGGVGGGWADTGSSNISLAWMMDQLASIGVEFDKSTIERIYTELDTYYKSGSTAGNSPPTSTNGSVKSDLAAPQQTKATITSSSSWNPFKRSPLHWAIEPIYGNNTPVRPWGLGLISNATSFIYKLAGTITRSPGMYKRVDKQTGKPTAEPLQDTNERIHSSVRVRLALQGLGLDDKAQWDCAALSKNWRLRRTTKRFDDPISRGSRPWSTERLGGAEEGEGIQLANGNGQARQLHGKASGSLAPSSTATEDDDRWVWEYVGPESTAPPQRILVEDRMGPYEQELLSLAAGNPNVYAFAEEGQASH